MLALGITMHVYLEVQASHRLSDHWGSPPVDIWFWDMFLTLGIVLKGCLRLKLPLAPLNCHTWTFGTGRHSQLWGLSYIDI